MANISNHDPNEKINGSSGNDSITNQANNVTILGGGGNDTITTYGASVTVFGGAGNDSIKSTGGSKVTLHGGSGNDTLTGSSSAEVFVARYDGGTDVITNFGSNDTLYVANGVLDTYSISGSDLIVTVGKSNSTVKSTIQLKNSPAQVKLKVGKSAVQTISAINNVTNTQSGKKITGKAFRDRITNSGSKVTIVANAGNDTIKNTASTVSISGGSGNDSVNNSGTYVTINGGAGVDRIINSASRVSIHGGAGNDTIRSSAGSYVTLNGGTGNDTLTGSSKADVFQFSSNGGKDVVTNFGTSDTLQITDGTYIGYSFSGNDMIVTAKGASSSGTIRLKNAASSLVKLKNGSGSLKTINAVNNMNNTSSNVILYASSVRDSIVNNANGVDINANAGNDTVLSNGASVSIDGGAGYDVIQSAGGARVTLHGGAGNDTLIGADNYDEIYRFQSDGGDDVIAHMSMNDTLYITETATISSSIVGDDIVVTVKGASATGTVRMVNASTDAVKVKVGTKKVQTLNTANVVNKIYSTANNNLVTGNASRDSIINSASSVKIQPLGSNDTIINSGSNNIYQFGTSDGNNLLIGFADNDAIEITNGAVGGSAADGEDYVVTIGSGSSPTTVTLRGAEARPIRIITSTGNESSLNTVNEITNGSARSVVGGTSRRDSILNTSGTNVVTINGGAGSDTINAQQTNYASIFGGTENDYIFGNINYSTLKGGAGNDTINSTGANNIYQIGALDGNDLIRNFTRLDTLAITDGSLSSHSRSGNNYIVKLSDGTNSATVTLEGASHTPIHVSDRSSLLNYSIENYTESSVVSGTSSADHIYNNASRVTIKGAAGNDFIYDDSSASSVTIDGGAGADTIFIQSSVNDVSLFGGAGNDVILGSRISGATIRGGEGNDTVSMIGGSNVYQFGASDGNDLYTDFTENDTIRITEGTLSGYSVQGNDAIISVNSGSNTGTITLRGAAVLSELRVVDSAGKTDMLNYQTSNHVNSTEINGSSDADSIYNSGLYVTINASDGNDQVYNDGSYAVINGAGGDDSLDNNGGYSTINGGDGNDYIHASNSHVTVNGGAGNDRISVEGMYHSIVGGEGDDSIYNSSTDVTINAGVGNDTIADYGSGFIEAGDGDDYISGTLGSTIRGGAGNDTIAVILPTGSAVYQIGVNEGNDVITGFRSTDTIKIMDGSITEHSRSGNDYVLKIGEATSLTLQGAGSIPINIEDANGNNGIIQNGNITMFTSNAMSIALEDYWFTSDASDPSAVESSDPSFASVVDPLEAILPIKDSRIAMHDGFNDAFNVPSDAITFSAHHRQKK